MTQQVQFAILLTLCCTWPTIPKACATPTNSNAHVSPVSSKVTEMCRTLKEFQEMGELSNTSLNARIWSFLKMTILCFASHCFLILINLINLAVVVATFWLSVFASIFASVSWLFLPCSQS